MAEYTHPGIRLRRKGERYDQSLLGDAFDSGSTRGIPNSAKKVTVSVGQGYKGYSTTLSKCYFIEVTLTDGTVVPCYSYSPAEQQDGYMICQNKAYKAAKAEVTHG